MPGTGEEGKAAARNWRIQEPWTVWQQDGVLKVGRETPSAPKAQSMTLSEISQATQAPASLAKTSDDIEDAKDMEQAKQAVEESLAAKEAHLQDKAAPPEENARPAEEASHPISKDVGKDTEPLSSSPSKVISPPTTNTQNQTSEKNVTANPSTNEEEKPTAIVSGKAQDRDAVIEEA
jgi:hypothetical protein